MVKGFSDNKVKNDAQIKDSKKEKKGLASFLKGKKFTYTLPGKKQINIFGSIVIGLNVILILLVILYLNNQEFNDFVFNVGRYLNFQFEIFFEVIYLNFRTSYEGSKFSFPSIFFVSTCSILDIFSNRL